MGRFALKPKPVPPSGFAPILSPTPVNMVDAKSPAKKAAKPKAPAAHPPVASMVKAAVKALKERNGSSLPAIKKYIAANYKVDIVKLNRFINKALKNMTEKGVLTKVKGSYKLSAKTKEEKPKKAKSSQEEGCPQEEVRPLPEYGRLQRSQKSALFRATKRTKRVIVSAIPVYLVLVSSDVMYQPMSKRTQTNTLIEENKVQKNYLELCE